jgi:histidinol phosphatase-like enzyme
MDTLAGNAPPREYADGKMLAVKDGGIGFITFNQPEKRNAMSVEMWQGLAEILDYFREDSGVRVVIMNGAGGKAFVSGADISQFEKRRANADAQEEYAQLTSGGRARLANFPKPSPAMFEEARAALGPGRYLVVGDRLDSDIAGGAAAGMETALVLTGSSSLDDLALWQGAAPDHVLHGPGDVVPLVLGHDQPVAPSARSARTSP